MLPAHKVERLQRELEAVYRAHALSALDHARGRAGPGRALHSAIHSAHGGSLPMFMGKGQDTPSYSMIEGHLGNGLAMMGGSLPMMHGEGFMSFLKKIGSLGKKVVSRVAEHGAKALNENRQALIDIGARAANSALDGTGSVGDRLRGGISRAASDVSQLARDQSADRLRAIIA